jgi:protein phosphatase
VELWTIGAFARAARLSPKALRLYDDLGLLPPAAVDGETGYRYYDPDQLDTARMIARLRRLGMPLARVRRVVDLAPQAAATEIEAYWAEVVAETAKRERLATFLVDYLSRRATTVQHADAVHDEFSTSESTGARGSRVATMAAGQRLVLRCAARTDAGLVRAVNADAAYAGPRLARGRWRRWQRTVGQRGRDRGGATAAGALDPGR